MLFAVKVELITERRLQFQCPASCATPDRVSRILDPKHVDLPLDHLAEKQPDEELWRCRHCGLVWFQSLESVITHQRGRDVRRVQLFCRLVGSYDAVGAPGFRSLAH